MDRRRSRRHWRLAPTGHPRDPHLRPVGLPNRRRRARLPHRPLLCPGDLARAAAWDALLTAGRLEWFLLGNAQNHREALLDQGGARRWRFHCGLRRSKGTFDDAGIYSFAAGVNVPAELVATHLVSDGAWIFITYDGSVIPLGAWRDDGVTGAKQRT